MREKKTMPSLSSSSWRKQERSRLPPRICMGCNNNKNREKLFPLMSISQKIEDENFPFP